MVKSVYWNKSYWLYLGYFGLWNKTNDLKIDKIRFILCFECDLNEYPTKDNKSDEFNTWNIKTFKNC